MNLPPTLLLDLDDTILDITGSADVCWRALSAEHAPSLGLEPETLCEAIVAARTALWADPARVDRYRLDIHGATREILTDVFTLFGVGHPDVALAIADHFREVRNSFLEPFPDAINTLERLRALDVRLALLTNGAADWQRAKIEKFDLARYFDCILIEGECGYGKPDERIYRRALETLGAEASAAWMVGDNLEWDVAAAQRLGLLGIWIDPRRTGLPPSTTVRPDRVIARIADLLPTR